MAKKRRKPKPSVPYWEWLDRDGCWFCKTPNACSGCKANKKFMREHDKHKIKGQH